MKKCMPEQEPKHIIQLILLNHTANLFQWVGGRYIFWIPGSVLPSLEDYYINIAWKCKLSNHAFIFLY